MEYELHWCHFTQTSDKTHTNTNTYRTPHLNTIIINSRGGVNNNIKKHLNMTTPDDKYQQWYDAVISAFVKYDDEYAEELRARTTATTPTEASPPPVAAAPSSSSATAADEGGAVDTTDKKEEVPVVVVADPSPPVKEAVADAQTTVTKRISDDGEPGAISTLRTPAVSNLPSCKMAQKYLRELVDASQSVKLAERLCALVEPLVAAFQERPLHVCTEPVLAMLIATFISNLAAHTTVTSDLIDGSTLVDFFLILGQHHRRVKKAIIAILSAMSNVMHLDKVALPADVAEVMIVLIAPLYSEATVVEVWAGAVANMVIRCPDSWQLFIQADTTTTMERLLMYFGDDPRILRSGLHCLTALSLPVIVPNKHSRQGTAAPAPSK